MRADAASVRIGGVSGRADGRTRRSDARSGRTGGRSARPGPRSRRAAAAPPASALKSPGRAADSAGMGRNLPTDPHRVLDFVAAHAEVWAERRDAIGATPEQIAAVEAALAAAEEARLAAEQARSASLAATQRFRERAQALRGAAAAVVRAVQARAADAGDRGVYALAHLSPPDPRSRTGPAPEAPFDLGADLLPTGELRLRWRTRHPRGVRHVVYAVARGLDGAYPTLIGHAPSGRTWIDATIPAGTRTATYVLTPLLGRRAGPPSLPCTVSLGVGAGRAAPDRATGAGEGAKGVNAASPPLPPRPGLAA